MNATALGAGERAATLPDASAVARLAAPRLLTAPAAGAERALRRALGQFATGVAIATTSTADGAPVGLTVNSFASVSLAPPLVLWCIARHAHSYPAFAVAPRFALSVLAADQQALGARFAAPVDERFAGVAWWRGPGGVPLVAGAAAHFACRVALRRRAGDHVIVVGAIDAYGCAGGAPLVFHDGRYASATPLAETELAPATARRA